MSKAEHTKGPWAVNPTSAQVDAFVGVKPLPICQLLWPTDERTEAETEANAHLIAAAPDLLAALKRIVVVADRATVEFDRARAAIAKAEGR